MKEEKKRMRNAISALVVSIILALLVLIANYIENANKIDIVPDNLKPVVTGADIQKLNQDINTAVKTNVTKPNVASISKEINRRGVKMNVKDINELKNQINQPQLQ
jgi:hypothetical protein